MNDGLQNAVIETPAGDAPATVAAAPKAPRKGSRKFAMIFIASFAFIVLLGFWVNVSGNSTGLFPSSINPSMAERAWKTRRVDDAIRRNRKAGVVIMGSSRMMQANPEYIEGLTGQPTFNYGVSAAGPLDFLTQLKYMVSKKYRPKTIVLGLDESAFAEVSSQYEIQTVAHWGLLSKAPFPENFSLLGRALGNVTPETTWMSLMNIVDSFDSSGKNEKGAPKRERNLKHVSNVMLENGYIIYKDRAVLAEEDNHNLDREIQQHARKWVKMMGSGEGGKRALEPLARRVDLFDQYLKLAKDNGIEVRVLLLPMHPDFERAALTADMMEDRDKLNGMLKAVCEKYGTVYKDFRKVESYGGDLEQFWDGAHQRPENMRRMMNAAFDKPPMEMLGKLRDDAYIMRHLPKATSLNTY